MHSLLKRQLERHGSSDEQAHAPWRAFIQAVNEAYVQFDEERVGLEHSLGTRSAELRRTDAPLTSVLRVLPDLFMRIDENGTILERCGGASNDPYASVGMALRGRKLQNVPERSARRLLLGALQRVVRDNRLVSVEYDLAAGSEMRRYEARLLPLTNRQIVVIVRDISERKEAELALAQRANELLRSNRELQQVAYVASHDLQQPLRTVQSYLQLLKRRCAPQLDNVANELIDGATGEAQRMRQLIQDLLSYAGLTSQAKPLELVCLQETVAAVRRSLRVAIDEKSACIHAEGLPQVLADASQLRQLLQNLLGNALKFTTGRAPCITIQARRQGLRWQIAVRDNGIGMEQEFLEKIFVIFKRIHSREQFDGTGMGLAICRKIVERHGGHLRAESKVGVGSVFLFDLAAVGAPHVDVATTHLDDGCVMSRGAS